jgi:hypothetical protein
MSVLIQINGENAEQAIQELAALSMGIVGKSAVVTTPEPTPNPAPATVPVPMTAPVQSPPAPTEVPTTPATAPTAVPTANSAPAQVASASTPSPTAIPTAAPVASSAPATVPTAAPKYDFNQLATATMQLQQAGQNIFEIFGQFGIQALNQLPKERYAEYAAVLRERGAKI